MMLKTFYRVVLRQLFTAFLVLQTVSAQVGIYTLLDYTYLQELAQPPEQSRPNNAKMNAEEVELLSFRTIRSKTFVRNTADGPIYRLRQSQAPLHFLNTKGSWQDISLRILPGDDGTFANTTNTISSQFPAQSGAGPIARLSDEQFELSISLLGIQSVPAQLESIGDGDQLRYKEAYRGLDVVFRPEPERVVKEFVFKEYRPEITEVRFMITVPFGATAKLHENQIILFQNDAPIARVPPPLLYEVDNRTRGWMLEGGVDFKLQQITDRTYMVTKILSVSAQEWMQSSDRVYPIALDATLNLQTGASTDDAYMGSITTGSGRSVTASAVMDLTNVKLEPGDHGSNNEHSAGMRFTSVSLANAENIVSSTLILTPHATYDAGSNVVKFHVSGQAADDAGTFTSSSGNLNTTARPRTTADAGPWTQTAVTGDVEESVTVTTVVQELVDRAGWASGNDMVILLDTHTDTSASEWQDYWSYDGSTTKAPQLDIEYGAATTYEQEGFRFREDDGSETTATWLASQDTNITRAEATATRLRVLVNAGSDPPSTQYRLDYKLSSDSTYKQVRTGNAHPVVAASNVTNGTSLSGGVALNMPVNISAGDLLIIFASNDNTGGTNMGVSGWTQLFHQQYTGNVVSHGAWAKIAAGSDTATLTGASQDYAAATLRITGHGVTTIGTDIKVGTPASTSDAAPNPPSLDAGSSAEWLWLESFGADDDDNTATYWSTNYTGVAMPESAQTTSSTMTAVAYRQNTTQTENPGVMAMALAEEAVANTIAIPTFQEQIILSPSANVTASGQSTTVQLTAPSGKSTSDFVTGRMQDDENPADAIDITTDDYTELEWSIVSTAVVSDTEVYQFRVTRDGTALDTYTVTPQMTIGTVASSTFTQSSYRWYVDNDSENVSAVWGNPDIAEDTALALLPATNATPVNADEIRLRVAITVGTANLSASTQQFKLQYKAGTDESCTTGSWTDVGAGGGGVIWRYATSSVTDGTTLTVLKLTVSDVLGVYVKASPTATNPNGANTTQALEYDFHLQHNAAGNATTYSFRVVESDGTELSTYSECPTLSTRQVVDQELRHGNVFGDEIERGMTRLD